MLIPIGVPELAKVRISKEVKSGLLNSSTSKSLPQVNNFINSPAFSTKFPKIFDFSLSTIDTNPSHSALFFKGSR